MSSITASIRHFLDQIVAIYQFVFQRLLPRLGLLYMFFLDLAISIFSIVFGRLLKDLNPTQHNLSGKVAIVTGGNSGIGLQIAIDLARQNAIVYLACRNESKFQSTINNITWQVPESLGRVKAMKLDTSSLENVREFALLWSNLENNKIDILCHNAGISHALKGHEFTLDGVEMTYATNFLGSFLLTHFLEPYLAPSARLVFTSSTGQYSARFAPNFSLGPVRGVCEFGFHAAGYSKFGITIGSDGGGARYANTKAMQVAFAKLLQRRFDNQASNKEAGARRTAQSFSPGFTFTPIFSKVNIASLWTDPLFVILKLATALATKVEQGAATGVWLASTDDKKVIGPGSGGGYYDRMQKRTSSVDLMPEKLLERFWIRWEKDAGIEWRV